MAVGWLGRRTGILPAATSEVITLVVYWLAAPSMLFATLSVADLQTVIGWPLLVAAVSGFGSALVFLLLAWLFLRPSKADLTVGAMSASLNNAAYIGIPVAVYVLGAASHAVPILIFQLGLLSPMFFVLANLVGSGESPSPRVVVRQVVTNPMVIAAALGIVVAWLHIPVPLVIAISTEMLGAAAAPMVLVAFGASMYMQRFRFASDSGRVALLSTLSKSVLQPAIAFGTGLLLSLPQEALLGVTVMAALPTAQTAFIAASRAGHGEKVAQATVLATNVISLPLILLITWVFHLVGG